MRAETCPEESDGRLTWRVIFVWTGETHRVTLLGPTGQTACRSSSSFLTATILSQSSGCISSLEGWQGALHSKLSKLETSVQLSDGWGMDVQVPKWLAEAQGPSELSGASVQGLLKSDQKTSERWCVVIQVTIQYSLGQMQTGLLPRKDTRFQSKLETAPMLFLPLTKYVLDRSYRLPVWKEAKFLHCPSAHPSLLAQEYRRLSLRTPNLAASGSHREGSRGSALGGWEGRSQKGNGSGSSRISI